MPSRTSSSVPKTSRAKATAKAVQARKKFFESHHAENDKNRYSITIEDKSPIEVFNFWRNFKNLTLFMKGLSEIVITSPQKSHWVVKVKPGIIVEWDAKITQESLGEMISWQSLPDSQVSSKGTVYFTPATSGEGTQVTLSMDYTLPGGKLAELATTLVGESPDQLAQINLRRLKAYLETGEVPTTEGQPNGENEISSNIHH